MRLRNMMGWLVLCASAWIVAWSALAQDAAYQATVPVADTSSAARGDAFAVALDHVLARVAGHPLDYAKVNADAATYVQQYQYQRAPAGASAPFLLTVDFAPSSIRHLIDSLSVAGASTVPGANATSSPGMAMPAPVESTVWVSNLHSALDFAGALVALRSTPGVEATAVQEAGNGGMLLKMRTVVPLEQVLTSVEGDGRLVASDTDTMHAGATASLRWVK
ncbi:MAG TPA: DUF2066 domain-containing protein [Rhodanobacteraceae bacterium]|nr:DUF2066 domain-containing protein [Rhodanobacteraceae bacterium]